MKLSKALLQSIAVGLTLGAAASCSYLEDSNNAEPKSPNDDSNNTEVCKQKTTKSEGHTWDNCPACGMG